MMTVWEDHGIDDAGCSRWKIVCVCVLHVCVASISCTYNLFCWFVRRREPSCSQRTKDASCFLSRNVGCTFMSDVNDVFSNNQGVCCPETKHYCCAVFDPEPDDGLGAMFCQARLKSARCGWSEELLSHNFQENLKAIDWNCLGFDGQCMSLAPWAFWQGTCPRNVACWDQGQGSERQERRICPGVRGENCPSLSPHRINLATLWENKVSPREKLQFILMLAATMPSCWWTSILPTIWQPWKRWKLLWRCAFVMVLWW